MNKVSTIIIVILSIIISILSFFIFDLNQKINEKNELKKEVEIQKEKNQILQNGTGSLIFSSCDFEDVKKKEKCENNEYYFLAMEQLDKAICDKILNNETSKNICKDSILKKEISDDYKITSFKTSINKCEKLETKNIKNDCKNEIIFKQLNYINGKYKEKIYVDKMTKKEILNIGDFSKVDKKYVIEKKEIETEIKPEYLIKLNEDIESLKLKYAGQENVLNTKIEEITKFYNQKDEYLNKKEVTKFEINKTKTLLIYIPYKLEICNLLEDENKCKNEFLFFNKRDNNDCKLINNEVLKNNCIKK